MPRPKTLPDEEVLQALGVVREGGPEALTFSAWPGPAGSPPPRWCSASGARPDSSAAP